jgi:cation diffusion facilitator CzcD-associated flavoprotein CzcO
VIERRRILIVGAGFAGLGMAAALRAAGIEDFSVLEKGDDVGGVWRDNVYPGAACDIPSHLYSFSFEPKADWSRSFAPQPEILEYLRAIALKYQLRRHMRFQTEVQSADFDEQGGVWRITSTTGQRFDARIVVTACGQLNRPLIPALPGVDRFRGAAFHSARWDETSGLAGKRVAVVGTGASAIQIVPSIVDKVRRLHLFQRSAPYVIAKADRAYLGWERSLFDKIPAVMRLTRGGIYTAYEARALGLVFAPPLLVLLQRAFRRHLEDSVADPELRRRLTPDYPFGCKRVLLSNDYYPALQRPNAELVTDAIREVTTHGIVTADGRERAIDTIVYATGFKATEFLAPMAIRGRGGRELRAEWKDGAEAYLGIAVSGFPNLFMLYGPNTNLGHNSIIYMLESQIRYVTRCVQAIEARRLRYVDVAREAQTTFNAEVQRRIAGSIWSGDCTSWYKSASGKHTNNWPGFTFDYRRRTREPDFSDYEIVTEGAAS